MGWNVEVGACEGDWAGLNAADPGTEVPMCSIDPPKNSIALQIRLASRGPEPAIATEVHENATMNDHVFVRASVAVLAVVACSTAPFAAAAAGSMPPNRLDDFVAPGAP